MTIKVFISALLLTLCSFVYGQNAKKQLKNANSFFEQKLYKQAVPAYLEAIKIEPNNAEANYKLGVSYLNTIHQTKAMPYLQKAVSLNPQIAPDVYWQLGRACQLNHEYEKALTAYKEHKKKINPKEDKEGLEMKKVDRKIFECENGIEYMKNPVKAKIENMGSVINSSFEDFAPVITPDESILLFTSRRQGSTGNLQDEDKNNEPFEDIYISYRKNGAWTAPKNVGKPINTEGHDASIAITPDGNQIFIYKQENYGTIYLSKFTQGQWSKPEELSKSINSKYGETSITLTSDGQTAYFTSDRPGGLGDLDIYVVKKDKKGRWGEPVSLGPTINTPYSEDSPFIHPDGRTLYFSSKGHSGMGGFDIFKTTLKADGKWSEPEHLGYPINTADDDLYFVLSADNKHGYYSSEREDGLGDQDLYMISMPEPEKLASVSSKDIKDEKTTVKRKIAPVAKVESFNPITILKGTISDALTKDKLEADVVIIDNDKNEVITEMKSNATTGGYLVVLPSGRNYGIRVQRPDYLFHSENFDIPSSANYQEIVKDVELKKVAVGTKIVLRNIFFDFDKATLRPQSTAELERLFQLMTDVPNLKIEISGHTDNKGAAEYNKDLSERRAKAVVDYLVGKGINASRLKYAGYGFDRPIAPNDSDEGRQLNRRTEFEIIGN
jgi:outer membrane protein OmpA-like peptidoglycan-associated protein/tetratricopeptide (TPR) repeat protein